MIIRQINFLIFSEKKRVPRFYSFSVLIMATLFESKVILLTQHELMCTFRVYRYTTATLYEKNIKENCITSFGLFLIKWGKKRKKKYNKKGNCASGVFLVKHNRSFLTPTIIFLSDIFILLVVFFSLLVLSFYTFLLLLFFFLLLYFIESRQTVPFSHFCFHTYTYFPPLWTIFYFHHSSLHTRKKWWIRIQNKTKNDVSLKIRTNETINNGKN